VSFKKDISYNGLAQFEVTGKCIWGRRVGEVLDSESFPLLFPAVYKNGQGFLKGWKTVINLKGIEKGCSVSAVAM